MHIHLSKQTAETFNPKPAADMWLETANQVQGASAASSSSTMQESEAEDSEGNCTY